MIELLEIQKLTQSGENYSFGIDPAEINKNIKVEVPIIGIVRVFKLITEKLKKDLMKSGFQNLMT